VGNEKCVITGFWLEGIKGRDHSGDLGIDEEIILKWIVG
jgi:hypothetical protein